MTESARSRPRIASPTAAAVLGGLCLLVVLAAIPLEVASPGTFSVSGSDPLSDATGLVLVLAFASVGVVIARRQPRNPVGWLLLGATLLFELGNYAPSYTNLDYLQRHGTLPLGHVALLFSSAFTYGLLMLPPILLLFPDGRVGRWWRWALRAYLAICLYDVAATVSIAVRDFRLRAPLDSSGTLVGLFNHSDKLVNIAEGLGLLAVFVLSGLAALHQVLAYRRASGERRQQLKWLGSGAVVCAVLLPTFLINSNAPSLVGDLVPLGLTAVPLAIGIGILRCRLYEIDRLISRTLSYAILTGLLVGTFIGLVALTTDTLALSGRVGVAASTLAAAALFNPLRVRIQRLVDRRFNRARYDAEATVAAFTARLRDAVEIDVIRSDLLDTVNHAVQPTHASVWIKP
jgi:hypothetical protein